MQAKIMLNKLKKMEKKVLHPCMGYVFFEEPTKLELSKLPPNARIVIFTGEKDIKE